MAKESIDLTRLDEANLSELVALCRVLGDRTADHACSREDLLERILYHHRPEGDPLARQRQLAFAFVHSDRLLQTVLTCDARCHSCPAQQVVICWAKNHRHFDP